MILYVYIYKTIGLEVETWAKIQEYLDVSIRDEHLDMNLHSATESLIRHGLIRIKALRVESLKKALIESGKANLVTEEEYIF